jgi:hypothetical protein
LTESVVYRCLNSDDVADQASEKWGKIHHPTLVDICESLERIAALHGRELVVLLKADVRGAFKLLSWQSSDVATLGFPVYPISPESEHLEGAVYFALVGNFGWSGLPMVFEVVTRFMRVVLSFILIGIILMFVDDVIVATTIKDEAHDRAKIKDTMITLLGPNSYADEKDESTSDNPYRKIVLLGWIFDLIYWSVDIAPKNRDRALYYFWYVDEESVDGVTLHDRQQLTSLAQRYSVVHRELRALTPILNGILAGSGRSLPGSRKILSGPQRSIIRLWRAYLLVASIEYTRKSRIGRCIRSFCSSATSLVIEFDGSLTGLGWKIFDLSSDGHEHLRELGQVVFEDFGIALGSDSSYQNACETCAFTMALCHCSALGYRDIDIRLRGDSTTALAWGSNEMYKSRFALAAVLQLVAVCELREYRISGFTEWIASEVNEDCDALSRGKIPLGFTVGACGSGNVIVIKPGGFGGQCVMNCNPLWWSRLLSTEQFIVQWQLVKGFFKDESSAHMLNF